jgi:serine/threonine protein kinase
MSRDKDKDKKKISRLSLNLSLLKSSEQLDMSNNNSSKNFSYRCNYNYSPGSPSSPNHNRFKLHDKYNIIKSIYESSDAGIYIVNNLDDSNTKYFIKVKTSRPAELDVYKILKEVKSDYLVTYINFEIINANYVFTYEYFESNNLKQFIKNDQLDNKNNKQILNIFKQIIYGLSVLHNNFIIHGDIKPENILINDIQSVKITDFDLSRVCYNNNGYKSNDMFGTMNYMAPESYDLNIYSTKSDMWSAGIVLYNMITNKYPHNMNLTDCNSGSNLYRYNEFKHFEINIEKDSMFYDIIINLLNFVDNKRYSADELSIILEKKIDF